MKKFIYSAMAVAMLATTSCKDDFAETLVGEEATVEFSISTPEIGTRAYSDGMTATKLQYAVYDAAGTELTALRGQGEKMVTLTNGKANVKLDLTTGESYQVIFWADAYGNAENAPYTVDFASKTMTVNYTGAKSNDENRDAFYVCKPITVNGAQTENIELKRPFAQLNIGTNDYAAATDAGYTPNYSYVKVPVYTTLNLSTGEVDGQATKEFAYNAIPTGETFPVAGYEYLAMNYLLVDADQEVVDIEFGYKGANDAEHTRTVGSVPVQRNYRTNIYGKLLTSTVDVNVEIVPDYNEPDYNNKYEVSTATDLQDAIYDAVAAGNGVITLTADITANEIITIGTNTRSNAGTQNAQIVIEGNGKKLTSTAGRAINVETEGVVAISNLTIKAAERAINIINKPATVELNHVTATANNNAVMMATSATGAKLTINESDLTGLATVNVASANSKVEINNTNITNVDASDAENYGAISVFKTATNSTVVVNGGKIVVADDSMAASIGAEGSTVTFNGTEGADKVQTIVAYIGDAGFTTLQDAIAYAKDGNTITLIRDFETSETFTIEGKNITIDLNGKTVNAPSSSAFVAKKDAELTIKNGKVVAHESTVSAQGGKIIVESGEYTSTGTAVSTDTPTTRRYSLDCRDGGELVVNGGTFKSNNGMINVGSTVTINGGKFENVVEKTMTRHFAYVSAPLTINDGEFYGKANSGAGGCFFCGAAPSGNVTVNGGKFTSLWTSGSVNKIFEVYNGGSIQVTGGLFNTNGGIASFVEENTDAATKDAYPYKAK